MVKIKIILSLVLFANLSFGQKTDTRLRGLETEIENIRKAYNAAGLSIAIVENNKIIYSKGFGYRDVENQLPVTENTIFAIGSATKAFTATLLGLLENQNQLSIKDKPSQYLPKLQFYNDRMDNLITIEDLLCHKSSVGGVDGTFVFFPTEKREDLIPRMKYLKPTGPIKDSLSYSNCGYVLAGTIVEKITNKSWEENIDEQLFKPLHMNNSSTSNSEMLKSNDYSLGYGMKNGKSEKVLYAKLKNDNPAGGINSNTIDLANWMSTWLNNGVFQNKQIIPKNYIKEATTIKVSFNWSPPGAVEPDIHIYGYGYGWGINSYKGHYKVFHGGNVSGFSSLLTMFPTDSLGIIVLTNQHNSFLPHVVSEVVADRLLKLHRKDWNKYPVKVSEIHIVNNEVKPINTEKIMTHSLKDYSGKYSNPGYGTFEIVKENDNLYAIFSDYRFRLEHQYYDIFVFRAIKEIPQVMNPGFYLNFSLDNEGNIASVKINMQNEPVEFLKQQKE